MKLTYHLKFIRYGIFGSLNTLITFLLYTSLIKLGVNYILASTACYIVGIIEGFLFNAWFVFYHKPQINSLKRYALVYIVAYLINIALLYNFANYFSMSKIVAQLLAIIIVTILNFKLVKLLVFKG